MISLLPSFSWLPGPDRHYTYEEMKKYLQEKHKGQHLLDFKAMKRHWDECRKCWDIWNKVRWDAAKTSQGVQELREYLGFGFVDYFDSSWALVSEWQSKEPETKEEISAFYKHTNNYLYNLTIWYESGERYDFTQYFQFLKKTFNVSSYIDYGCGVGNDGLNLLKNHNQVYFVDFDCPSTDFLKWRLKKRHLQAEVLDVEKIKQFPDADVFWAIDVLEHMADPLEVLDRLSPKTKLFVHLSQFNNKAGGRHPFHINFNKVKLDNKLKKLGFKYYSDDLLDVWVKK